MTEQPNDGPDRQDAKAAWSEAGERLTGLGSRLRQHYQQHAQAPAEQTGNEVKDAARRLNLAVHTAFEAVASASKDESVKDDARRAGRSVADALSGAFAGISGELGRTFGGSSTSGPAAAQPDPAAPGDGSPDRPSPAAAPVRPVANDDPPHGGSAGTPYGSPPGVPDPGSPEAGPPDSSEPGPPA